jgi:hypothetical protein
MMQRHWHRIQSHAVFQRHLVTEARLLNSVQ